MEKFIDIENISTDYNLAQFAAKHSAEDFKAYLDFISNQSHIKNESLMKKNNFINVSSPKSGHDLNINLDYLISVDCVDMDNTIKFTFLYGSVNGGVYRENIHYEASVYPRMKTKVMEAIYGTEYKER